MERPAMVATGVPQLDTILGGGIAAHSLLLLCGPPGSGKTVLASQIMATAVDRGEPVLLVTVFAEPQVKLIAHLRSFHFFNPEALGDPIKLLNLQHPLLTSLEAAADTLVREAHEHRARMVILDGLGAILLAGSEPLAPYRFLYNLSAKLSLLGITTVITLDLPPGAELQRPELTAIDSVVALGREAGMLRSLRVIKHRGAAPLPGYHRFKIDENGVQCFARLEALAQPGDVQVPQARAAFGVPTLDAAMHGGPHHTSSTLLRGAALFTAPLGLRWLLHGLAAEQRGYLLCLREPIGRLLGSSASGTALQQAADEQQLVLRSYYAAELLPDQLAHELLAELPSADSWRVVIDGAAELAPLLAAEGRERSFWTALLAELRARGATTLLLDDRISRTSTELDRLFENVLRIRRRQAAAFCNIHSMRFSAFDPQAFALPPAEA